MRSICSTTRYEFHGHHRRGRDFSSLARRKTLGILKKRMKGSVVELEPDLFAVSKSGFKLKMARNVSQLFRFVLFKYGKYRNSKFEVDFTPTIVPGGGIECSIKSSTKSLDKSQIDDKGQYTFYDVRFKSKERIGKFRCFLKILRNGKVCGNPLCISVRVKRFYSTSDHIDSAEEAVPGFSNVSPRSRPHENYFSSFEPGSAVNVDVDEGISVFQEYPSSVSSDSEDGETVNRENEKDEGIDTKLAAPCSAFEKLTINEKKPGSNFDEDTDSSLSLLLDENEVREVVDEDFDSVKIPPCFLPNTDLSKESVSVRVKRKFNSARRKKADNVSAHSAEDSSKIHDWWTLVFGDLNASSRNAFSQGRNSHSVPSKAHTLPRPAKEAKSCKDSSKTESSSKGLYESLYPTLEELHETPKKNSKKSTSSKETQSPVAILPEKVFEMTSNVFKSVMNSMKQPNDVKENIQKNVDEAFWSISRSVFGGLQPSGMPSEQPRAAAPSAPPAPPTEVPVFPTAAGPSTKTPSNTPMQGWHLYDGQFSTDGKSPVTSSPCSTFAFPDPPSTHCSPIFSPQAASLLEPTQVLPQLSPQASPPLSVSGGVNTRGDTPLQAAPMDFESPSVDLPISKVPSEPNIFAAPTSEIPAFCTLGTNEPMINATAATTEIPVTIRPPGNPSPTPSTGSAIPVTEILTSVAHSPVNQPQNQSTGSAIPITENRTPATHSPVNQQQKQQTRRTEFIGGEEYNRLEPEVRRKILQLNEMGFQNDSYNLFLIRKYPHDMDKVVESLVNYNDF